MFRGKKGYEMNKTKKLLLISLFIETAMLITPMKVFASSAEIDPNTMRNDVAGIIVNTLLIPLIPTLSAFIIALVKAKMADIKQNKYIDIAKDAVCTAVAAVAQTYVDEMKKAEAFDKDAMASALNLAKHKALAIMGTKAQEIVKNIYGDLDSWLENKIEYYVKLSK